jgi:class 3 adenylate cyclase/tetratricopeptide (TPR) repeat protein
MRCSKCDSDNREGRKFCANCGAPLAVTCPKCGASNQPGEKFCGDCGAGLVEATAAKPPEEKAIAAAGGERRHLTVLFCDLVGSTQIAARLDPEEWREVVASYHRAAAEAITRFGGQVAKYLGDGAMAYFGWPTAYGNDAERAVRAGLEILDTLEKLNQQSGTGFSLSFPVKLSARIGIHSGAVVVGASASADADIFGEAPNIAARVQATALPGTVLVTADTHRLVAGLFAVEEREAEQFKGIERQIKLFRVIRPHGARGRLEAAAARGLTPFVGRDDELRSLITRWERVHDGEGQVVLIIGEGGIGKSRLVRRFQEEISGQSHAWASAAAAPFYQNTPFYAVAELLRELLAAKPNESPEESLGRLESSLEVAGCKPAEGIPLIAPIFNLALSDKYQPSSLAPEQQRRRLLAILAEWLFGFARKQPLAVAIEDLHWADPSTLELIQLLGEQGAATPAMLLYTARPEFRPQSPLRAHHTQITVNRLSARHTRTMVEKVAARKALADETIAAVIERTGGVPLFVEELTRAVLERDESKPAAREIPVTLHDSLMARMDRLGPAKEVLQVGAVIGSEFSYNLLRALNPIGEEELQHALRSLTDAELLYVRGIAPDATYQFKHALIRDAAYEALLKSRRRELHRLVAAKISEEFPALKQARPEVLARHWSEADEIEPAIDEWSRAGSAAEARNAFKEALESYQQAVALCSQLVETDERHLRELALRQSVVRLLLVAKGGAGAVEIVDAADRAAAAAEKSGALAQLVLWLATRGAAIVFSGDLAVASALADQALEFALRESSSASLGVAHNLKMQICVLRGDLEGAETHFAAGLPFFGDPSLRQLPITASNLWVFALASFNAWMLGRIGLARERFTEMLEMVNTSNPFEEAFSRVISAIFHIFLREYETAETVVVRALEISERHQFHLPHARCFLGHARAQLGRAAEGTALIQQGLSELFQNGVHLVSGWIMLFLAVAQEREGMTGDALQTLGQALEASQERFWRPEILRARGELRLKQGQSELAEADFREALGLARGMKAKSWELRATMSLARPLADTSRRDEARAMLAEVYEWFTEGFDTADLKDARALLDELSS